MSLDEFINHIGALAVILLAGLSILLITAHTSRNKGRPIPPRREPTPVDLGASFKKLKSETVSRLGGEDIYVNGRKVWMLTDVKILTESAFYAGCWRGSNHLSEDRGKTYAEWEKENLP